MPVISSSSGSISKSSDAALSNPANGQVLTYASALGKWQNQTLPKTTFNVDSYGADPTGVTASDTAVAAAVAALGTNPGTIEFGPGIYLLNSSVGTFGPKQNVIGAGRGTTQINFAGTGDCIRAYDPRPYTTSGAPGAGGSFKGYTISSSGAGAGSSGIHFGDLTGGHITDVKIQGFSTTGSIGLWMDNVVTWCEETVLEVICSGSATQVVFDSSASTVPSFDYSSFVLTILASANQNGIVLRNSVPLYGVDMVVRGNFQAGTTNTGTVLTIGTTSTDASNITASRLVMQVETGGSTGVGHKSFNIGAAGRLAGQGVLNFGPGNGVSFQTGNASSKTAFSGFINVDSDLGIMGYWQGHRSIGVSTGSSGYMSPTGTIYLNANGNYFKQQMTAGAQTVAVDVGSPAPTGQAITFELLIRQPASGTTTLTWPSSFKWLVGSPPTLSTTNNAYDHIRVISLDHTTYYAMHMNAAGTSGVAGGDLSGTLPNPTVAKVNGVAVTGTPTNGQVITATSGTAAAWATPAGGGGSTVNVVAKTANYTAANGDCVSADASGGAFVITSPPAVINTAVRIKKADSSTNTVTFTPASGTVDGNATFVLTNQYDAFYFICDGTNWMAF